VKKRNAHSALSKTEALLQLQKRKGSPHRPQLGAARALVCKAAPRKSARPRQGRKKKLKCGPSSTVRYAALSQLQPGTHTQPRGTQPTLYRL